MTANEKYNAFKVLTASQKVVAVVAAFELQLKTDADNETAQTAADVKTLADQATKKTKLIAFLQTKGFKCDNSKEDWYLLYNRQVQFGKDWQQQADGEIKASTGVDYFLKKIIELRNDLK